MPDDETERHPWGRWAMLVASVLLVLSLLQDREVSTHDVGWLLVAGAACGIILDMALGATWSWMQSRRTGEKR